MSQTDTDFVVGLLEQIPALTNSVYEVLIPKPADGQPPLPFPYATVYPTGGIDSQSRVSGPAQTEHPEFTIHLVGSSANQCQILTDLFKPAVKPDGFGIIPTVTGRRNQRMFWRQPIPIQTSTGLTPPLCFAVVEVGWTSDPS